MSSNDFTGPEGSSDPFEQVRAQDPAAGANPNLPHLWTTVDARIGTERATELPLGVTPIEAAPSRRTQRRWFQVAAAAVGVLAVGLGGYLVGNAGDSGTDLAATPAAVTSAAVTSQAAAVVPATPVAKSAEPEVAVAPPVSGSEGLSGVAPGAESSAVPVPGGVAPAPGSADTAKMSSFGGFGRTVFTAGDGLSGEAGTAPAWGFDATKVVTAKKAAALAKALGLKGEPREEYGAWTVGSNDGTGPVLSINPDATGSFNFYDPTNDPYYCPVPTDGAASTEPCEPQGVGKAPQGDAAVAAAKDALKDLGVDVAGLEFEVQEAGDPSMSYVNAFLVIDGSRSDLSFGIGLTGGGLQSVYGPLASVVSLGDYPVISAQEAVARLGDPRFGATSTNPILYAADVARSEAGIAGDTVAEPAAPTVPAAPEAGAAISWPVAQVTITKAELGSMSQYQADGSTLLLPSYTLTDDTGAGWTVIAVADSALDFTPSS